jgi:LmbE family N-acetylglucosaminyl deacetylase
MTTNLYPGLSETTSHLEIPRTVLTIGAHPDDAEFGAGGILSRWAQAGADITILVITDGSKGSWDPDEDQEDLIARRIAEQRAAADVLGANHCEHLGYVDGELEYTMALRNDIARAIRRFTPDVVLTHDPWQRYQLHPDHRVAGLAAVDGVITAREPLALRDVGLRAHRPKAILLWSADAPDHAERIKRHNADRKVEALLCHSSQGVTTMGDPERGIVQKAEFMDKIDAWHIRNGEMLGKKPSEIFKRLTP